MKTYVDDFPVLKDFPFQDLRCQGLLTCPDTT